MEDHKRPAGHGFAASVEAFIEGAGELRRELWEEATDRDHPGWPPAWLKVAAGVVAAAVLCFLVIPLVLALGTALLHWSGSGVRWLTAWDLAKVVTAPVRAYLDAHATGLPVDADMLWLAWLITGGVLLAFSLFGATGARVGWALFGAGTAAMVWAQTPTLSRGLAVGIAAAWWSALSLFAYRHRARRASVVVVPQQTGPGSHAAAAPGTSRVFNDDLDAALYVLDDLAKLLDLAATDSARRERTDLTPEQLTTRIAELRNIRTQLRDYRPGEPDRGRPDGARDWYGDLCWYLNNVPLLDASDRQR